MRQRLPWLLFASLAAFNVFGFATYEWTIAHADPAPKSVVDLASERIEFTPEERQILTQLETEVRQRRAELVEDGKRIVPEVENALLADELEMSKIISLFESRLPDRIAYLQFEATRLHEALLQLAPEKRRPLIEFLTELRLKELGHWVHRTPND